MEPNQPELFSLETIQGYGTLTAKERRFAVALFEGCNQSEAARRAGVEGSDEYIAKAASILVKKGKVQAVMNQAWVRSGASIDTVLKQAAELAQRAYAEAIAAQTPERRKLAQQLWRDAATLIASIHGKLSLKIDGAIHHTHENAVAIPPESLLTMAQMRRDVLTPGRS